MGCMAGLPLAAHKAPAVHTMHPPSGCPGERPAVHAARAASTPAQPPSFPAVCNCCVIPCTNAAPAAASVAAARHLLMCLCRATAALPLFPAVCRWAGLPLGRPPLSVLARRRRRRRCRLPAAPHPPHPYCSWKSRFPAPYWPPQSLYPLGSAAHSRAQIL